MGEFFNFCYFCYTPVQRACVSCSGVASPKKVGDNLFLCWRAVKVTIYIYGTPYIYINIFNGFA